METKELNLKEITVFGRKLKANKSNVVFTKYQYTNDGVKYYDVKFTKDCVRPEMTGYVKLTFDKATAWIAKGKVNEAGFQSNDVLWIRNLVSYEEDVEYASKHPSKKQKELDELFGD